MLSTDVQECLICRENFSFIAMQFLMVHLLALSGSIVSSWRNMWSKHSRRWCFCARRAHAVAPLHPFCVVSVVAAAALASLKKGRRSSSFNHLCQEHPKHIHTEALRYRRRQQQVQKEVKPLLTFTIKRPSQPKAKGRRRRK